MCLLGLAFRQLPDFPVLVLANREEFYARPTLPPQLFPRNGDIPAWIGGLDLTAGGTWLGINELGLVVAVTNRQKDQAPAAPPSRGLLCRRLLAQHGMASAIAVALGELEGNQYAGCNLLLVDRDSAYAIEAGNVLKSTRLEPGLHLITNAALNASDDLRIARVRKEFAAADPQTAESWIRDAEHICRLSGDGSEAPICLFGPDRGTVSSTVIGIGRDLLDSHYRYAPGPPATTPYEDFTPLFRQLLAGWADLGAVASGGDVSPVAAGEPNRIVPDIEPPNDSPARRAVRAGMSSQGAVLQVADPPAEGAHRILLRGPWQSEPLARAEWQPAGTLVWSETDLPGPATVRLPAFWQDLYGPFRGRIRFKRKFHPPSNIVAGDRLAIVFAFVGGHGLVSLNGEPLGRIELGSESSRFDVSGRLNVNNELAVEIEFTDFSAQPPPGGLCTPVALEIVS
ncbi:MAG TPA: NRDE family protein [Planctomycetaceae bacterium]|jgi:uncharacterized protein with NRDE domain